MGRKTFVVRAEKLSFLSWKLFSMFKQSKIVSQTNLSYLKTLRKLIYHRSTRNLFELRKNCERVERIYVEIGVILGRLLECCDGSI